MRKRVALLFVVLLFVVGLTMAQAATSTYIVTQADIDAAGMNFIGTEAQAFYGNGAWASYDRYGNCPGSASSAVGEFYIDPEATALGAITVDDLDSFVFRTYPTNVAATAPDFFVTVYTEAPPVPPIGQGSWYYGRLTFDPPWALNRNAVANTWNTWSTAAGTNQLAAYDSSYLGQTGFSIVNGPTLADLQAGPINWRDYKATARDLEIDYGPMPVMYIRISDGSPWNCAGFDHLFDALEITANGNTVVFDFEMNMPTTPAASGTTGSNAPTSADHAAAQAPMCADLDGSTDEIIRANVPGGTVSGGDVYCRVLARYGDYVTEPAEVGNMDVIDMGVYQAVDVFGMVGSTSVPAWNSSVQVCLEGSGQLYFLNALTAPRTLSALVSTPSGGYTCGTISSAGTVVLVQ